jgi:hypothetical protein
MITREQIETSLKNKSPFVTKNIDYDVTVINLLRQRIPYDECKSIIAGTGYDILYLCNVDIVINHLTEDDLIVLADCNCWIDKSNECIALFV